MMYAKKIKMKQGCSNSRNVLEIAEIYVDGCDNPGYFKKEALHSHLEKHPKTIKVNISPFPFLVPAISVNGEKYVRSEGNEYLTDNLLNLPRE